MMSFAKLLLIWFSPSGFINNAQITRCPGPRCLHHLIWLKDGLQRNKVGQEASTAGIHTNPAVFQLHPRSQRSPFTFETYRNYVGPLATIKHTNDFTTLLRHFISLPLSPIPVARWGITEMFVLSLGLWKQTEHKLSGVARILWPAPEVWGITGSHTSNVSPKQESCGHHYLFSTLRLSFTLLGSGSEYGRTTHVTPNPDSH